MQLNSEQIKQFLKVYAIDILINTFGLEKPSKNNTATGKWLKGK